MGKFKIPSALIKVSMPYGFTRGKRRPNMGSPKPSASSGIALTHNPTLQYDLTRQMHRPHTRS